MTKPMRHQDLALRWRLAALVFEAKLAYWRSEFARKYSPDQPRVPPGGPRGGQWTPSGGGGGGGAGGVGSIGAVGEGGADPGGFDATVDFGAGDIADFSGNIDVGTDAVLGEISVGPVQLAAGDGTPGNNQVQNKQVNDIARMVGLTKDQKQQLHIEISGYNLGFQEILMIAKDMQKR